MGPPHLGEGAGSGGRWAARGRLRLRLGPPCKAEAWMALHPSHLEGEAEGPWL